MLPTLVVGWRASALRGEEAGHKLAIDREMLGSSVDAGFVLVLPFHHGVLEPDRRSFDEGGLYARDNLCKTLR